MSDEEYNSKSKDAAPKKSNYAPILDNNERKPAPNYYPFGRELIKELEGQDGEFPDLVQRFKKRITEDID